MRSTAVADLIVLVLVSAAAFSTGWVLRDARARGLPRRKAMTWAALQWVEFPLFLWLYHRIRPQASRKARRSRPAGDSPRRAGTATTIHKVELAAPLRELALVHNAVRASDRLRHGAARSSLPFPVVS